ncbi:MAG: hypothetical protein ABIP94_00500 [Planctomycetota bacterium]
MATLRIIALCVLAAVTYGILHDQVTVRVCVEYFTIGHPRVFDTESATLLAIGWGVLATWWVGLLLGLLLAFAARRGRRPVRSACSLVRPILFLLLCMAAGSLLAGALGYVLANNAVVVLLGPLASSVPHERHAAFLADLWAHSASYFVGIVGGLVLCNRVWRSRSALATSTTVVPRQ